MSPARAGTAATRPSASAAANGMARSVPLRLQRTLQLGFVHLRAPRYLLALGLLVQLGAARVALGPGARSLAPALALLRALEPASVLRRALLVGTAGFVERDGDRLPRIAYLAPGTAFQLAMLELVHDPADDFLLLWVLLLRHHALRFAGNARDRVWDASAYRVVAGR